jgi:hypothetical protein
MLDNHLYGPCGNPPVHGDWDEKAWKGPTDMGFTKTEKDHHPAENRRVPLGRIASKTEI